MATPCGEWGFGYLERDHPGYLTTPQRCPNASSPTSCPVKRQKETVHQSRITVLPSESYERQGRVSFFSNVTFPSFVVRAFLCGWWALHNSKRQISITNLRLDGNIGGYLFLAFDLRHDHAFVIDLVQVLLIIGAGCSLYYEFTTSMTIVGLGQSENGLCLIGTMLLPRSHSFALSNFHQLDGGA